jgi:hypothetical protein
VFLSAINTLNLCFTFFSFCLGPRLFTFLSARYLVRRGEKLARKIAQLNTNTNGLLRRYRCSHRVQHKRSTRRKNFSSLLLCCRRACGSFFSSPWLRCEGKARESFPSFHFTSDCGPVKNGFCRLPVSSRVSSLFAVGSFDRSLASRRKNYPK